MASQADVARQFARGTAVESMDSASNFGAAVAPDGSPYDAVLLSYGWAVLAARKGRRVVVFDGWQGYSASTSTQHGKMRRVFRDVLGPEGFDRSDAQPQMATRSGHWRVRDSMEPITEIDT